jgi:hypothetical protein
MTAISMRLVISATLAAVPLCASQLTITASEYTVAGLSADSSYVVDTNNGGNLKGKGEFVPAASPLVTIGGLQYADYLSGLPGGYVLTGASLDFSGLFSLSSTPASQYTGGHTDNGVTSPTPFYTPTFGAAIGAYTVEISSNQASVQLNGSTAAGYNLWNVFASDLVSGNTIDVKWSAVATFTADTTTYIRECRNCEAGFDVTQSAGFRTQPEANSLNLTFSAATPPSAIPEPASLFLTGGGLIISALAMKRFKTRGQAGTTRIR